MLRKPDTDDAWYRVVFGYRLGCSNAPRELDLLGVIFNNLSCDRGSRNSQRRSQVHLTRSASSGKIAIDRADRDLFFQGADPRSGIDAGATTWLDNLRADLFEYIQIAFVQTVFAGFLRAKLDETVNVRVNVFPLFQSLAKDPGVHIHILFFATSA